MSGCPAFAGAGWWELPLPLTLLPLPAARCRNVKAVSEGWESRLWIFVDSLQIRGTVWLKSAFRAKRRGFPAI